MTACIIRRATYNDLPVLEQQMYLLHDEHYQAEPEHFKTADQVMEEKRIAEYIDAPDALVYVAEQEGKVIGFVTGHFGELISTVSKPMMMGSIDELYVLAEYRRQGAGKRLLDRCFSEFEDYGVKQVFVEVWDFNQHAVELYQQLGFEHHIHWLRKGL